ncbi:MAG: ABC transporter permease [Spirochaetaceae bacterium]|nr:MAG: ABC transporter permease [Spirochaetaceae bacterium]
MIEGIFVEGLIYGLMVLGVFITFRILDFPDLTVDGSFPLGAAITAVMITNDYGMGITLAVAFAGGAAAGVCTALIHNKLKVPNLLAGILTMTMLWSINIRVLGNRANLPLLRRQTIISDVLELTRGVLPREWALLLFFLLLAFVIKLLLDAFFRTDLGLTLGAMGDNQQMVVNQGVNPEVLKIIGVGLSNALVALSGAFAAQYQGFADVNLGQGIIIAGLASVMIGEFVLRSNKIFALTLRVLIGSICFRGLMYLGRYYGFYINLTPSDLQLITGVLIIVLLAITQLRGQGRWKGVQQQEPATVAPGTTDAGTPVDGGER